MSQLALEPRVLEDESALELRETGERPTIVGYAAVYNRLTSERFGEVHGFREEILPGAFAELLASKPDVRAFYGHDETRLLGRTKSGTLTLREDERGLYVEISPPDTQLGRDTVTEVRRGDLSGMSFRMGKVKDSFRREGGQVIRTISKVGRLVEVSPVSLPAYEDTVVTLRSLEEWRASEDAVMQRMNMRLRLASKSI